MEHFLDVGSQLENVGLDDPYAAEARAAMLGKPPSVEKSSSTWSNCG